MVFEEEAQYGRGFKLTAVTKGCAPFGFEGRVEVILVAPNYTQVVFCCFCGYFESEVAGLWIWLLPVCDKADCFF